MHPDHDVLTFDEFRLVVPMRALYHGETALGLKPQEFDALVALVRGAGTLLTKDDLARAIRAETCSDATLAQVIYRLRRTLALHAPATRFVTTVPGHGYQFVRPVTVRSSNFAASATAVRERVDVSCESAERLLRDGHAGSALERLHGARGGAESAAAAARVLMLKARALHALDRGAEGDAALEAARRAAAGAGEPNDLRSALLIAQAQVSYTRAEHAKALHEFNDGLSAQSSFGAEADPQRMFARVRALLFGANLEQEHGTPQRSMALSDAARVALEGVPDPPKADVAEALVQAAFARLAVPGALGDAQRDAERSLALAQRHGLGGPEAWATITLAIVAETAGRMDEAVAHARAATVVASRALGGDQLARIHLIAGRVEASAGNGAQAYALVSQATAMTTLPVFRGIVAMRESQALLALGDFGGAQRRASDGIATLSAVTDSHYIGTAYLAKARAESSSTERRARESVERAVAYLRRGGSVRDLSQALDLRFRLTRDRRSAREARELQNSVYR